MRLVAGRIVQVLLWPQRGMHRSCDVWFQHHEGLQHVRLITWDDVPPPQENETLQVVSGSCVLVSGRRFMRHLAVTQHDRLNEYSRVTVPADPVFHLQYGVTSR